MFADWADGSEGAAFAAADATDKAGCTGFARVTTAGLVDPQAFIFEPPRPGLTIGGADTTGVVAIHPPDGAGAGEGLIAGRLFHPGAGPEG